MEALAIAKLAAKALNDKKGNEIKLLKVEDLTVLTEYFLIASGTSSTHVKALSEEVDAQLSQAGVEPMNVEGARGSDWVLLDYGSVIVNVFYPEARDYYALEHLWADAQPVELELD